MRRKVLPDCLDGWLLIVGGIGIGLLLWLAPVAGASSRNDEARAKQDFDSLVHTIQSRYHMHANTVPMMWVANLCARRFTNGGVRGIKVVEFVDADLIAKTGGEPSDLGAIVKTQLGERWSPMVREHDKGGGNSYVYVRSSDEGNLTRMIVVDLDGAELDMVSLSLNPDQLAKWMKDHDSYSEKKTSSESDGSE